MLPSDVYKFSVLNAIIFLQIFFKQINVSQAKARISGGFTDSNYNLNLAKYVVSIRHSSAAEKYYFGAGHHCGGSILTTYFILTAAHCLEGRSENNYHVVIGTPRLFDRTFNTQISYVKKFIIHEYFNRYPIVNDIGLVELQNPIFIDYKTADVIGITDEPLPINGIYYAAGWGFVYENGPTPNEILYATTYLLLGNNKCNNDLYKIYGPWHPMLFCAGNLIDPEIQTYFGDSGGPLFYNSRVVGIVSYMTNLRVDGMSVFTNVSNYIPWIRRYVWFDLKPYGETTARRNIYEMKRRNERKSCGIVKNDKKSKIFYISFLILYMTLSHLSEIN